VYKRQEYWSLAHALWSLTRLDSSFAARAEELMRRDLRRVAAWLGLSADDPDDLALIDAIRGAIAGLALNYTFGWSVATIDASLDRLEEAFTPLLLEAIAHRQSEGPAPPSDRPGARSGGDT
jgi:hypothetical protein